MSAAKPSVRVILVGPSGVGKRSLLGHFFKQAFDGRTVGTFAPGFCRANVDTGDGPQVDLQIWDIVGQERFQWISTMFYRESQVALVGYDGADPSMVDQWVGRVRENAPDCQIILVVTKADLIEAGARQGVLNKQTDMMAQFEARARFVTSAVTAEGVQYMFKETARISRAMQALAKPRIDLAAAIKGKGMCC